MELNFLSILFSVLCFQILFVALFLFQNKKGKLLSNRLLGVVFLMIAVAVFYLYLLVFRVPIHIPTLLFIDDTFMFAYGPLLYLFTQSVLFKNYRLQRKNLWHFMPFILAICTVIGLVLFVDTDMVFGASDALRNQQIPMYLRIGELLLLGHIFYYLLRSKRMITRVIGTAKDFYSTFDLDNFRLLKFILNCFIILFLLALAHSLLPFMGIKNALLFTLLGMVLFMFYFINSILLKLLNQSTNASGAMTQVTYKATKKYAGSNLSGEDIKTHKTSLDRYMIETQPYLNSELSIADLSKALDVTPKVLSQVINEGYACNFFDFVNKHRVAAASLLFKNDTTHSLTIQKVMYDSGFHSKSSFNTAFRKFTKQTPTQYKHGLEMGSTS